MRRILILSILAVAGVIAISCGTSEPTPVPTLDGPFPSFPYVFSGEFTVNGEPGPAGVPIFARLGGTYSPTSETPTAGHYNNIIIGPSHERAEDLNERVTFHIGDINGESVQAEETFDFKVVSAPTSVELDLTFPRMP